jgi:tetratricopeptide (TPR) repeat protein
MKTTLRVLGAQVCVLTCSLMAVAQSTGVEIRATGQYRAARGENVKAERIAFAIAKEDVLTQAAVRLKDQIDVRSVPILPAVLEVEMQSSNAGVSAVTRFSPPQVANLLNQLRKDQNATAAITQIGAETRELSRQLRVALADSRSNATAKDVLVNKIEVNDVLARVYSALARTEESPASARVSSPKGRQRARHLAEVAVILGPLSPQARMAMGDALLEGSQPEAAEAEYRTALFLDPTRASAHLRLAEVLRLQDKTSEATVELREALRLHPTSAAAHTDLGFLLGNQQNNDAAIAEYREALRLDPDFIEAHNYLAIALARQGKLSDAVAEFREMVRVDPDSVLGYYNLAIALADLEKDDESAEALRQAVRVNPTHFNARFNLGELFRLEGKLDEAVTQFREYLRLAPDTPQNQRNIRRAREFVQTHENPRAR